MRHALASLFVILSTAASAQTMIATDPPYYVKFPVQTQHSILPPAEFDHPYTAGTLFIERAPWQQVSKLCGKQHALGCTRRELAPPYRCYVAIAPDHELMGYDYDYVLRHELGHCNGWRHEQQPEMLNRDLKEWCREDPALLICRGG